MILRMVKSKEEIEIIRNRRNADIGQEIVNKRRQYNLAIAGRDKMEKYKRF